MHETTKELTEKEIKLLKETFEHYLKLFNLSHYEISYIIEKIDDAYAEIFTDDVGEITLKINPMFCLYGIPNIEEKIKQIAKHEAIHALLSAFSNKANDRHQTRDDLVIEEELLVRKLILLIK